MESILKFLIEAEFREISKNSFMAKIVIFESNS